MKIINVVGARPNFMKVAPLMKKMDSLLVHTGQHYDKNMSDDFFKDLDIPSPDYNLGVGSASHAVQTAKIMIEFEKVCLKEKPDAVLVFGDVNSTIACGLVAVKLGIKLMHVEAGMRSFDKRMPEEINRVLTDHISDINFCSTGEALRNLKNEGIDNGVLVGDIMYDAFLDFSRVSSKSKILDKIGAEDYILLTMHRQGNVDDFERLSLIVDALCLLDEKIVYPVHPRTEKMLKKFNLYDKLKEKVVLIEPVCYIDMIKLLKNCKLVITDSGGLQKEAYFAKRPCITLRNETEWVETLGKGNVLCREFSKLKGLVEEMASKEFKFNEELYGDGKTAERIVEVLNGLHIK